MNRLVRRSSRSAPTIDRVVRADDPDPVRLGGAQHARRDDHADERQEHPAAWHVGSLRVRGDRGRDQRNERREHNGVAAVEAWIRVRRERHRDAHREHHQPERAPRHRLERRRPVPVLAAGDPAAPEPSTYRTQHVTER